ncbi:DUF3006 domain-containing protein [Defluviitalea phaphyphila]|uniref:DUF3006 domain-containing protein n=1 Tax=Defluviitalea phaphyphila TaxID=1473580 RepID=UPI000730ACE8|nr:DUF3006 domain-containing protein [Defluviitalea phaphyphila]
MKVIIDRFEGNFAIVELENKKMLDIPKELIPLNAREGDVLEIRINREETEKRKKSINSLMKNMWD